MVDFERIKQAAAKDTRTVTSGQIRWMVAEIERLRSAATNLLETMWHIQGSPLELAAKYGPDFEPPTEDDLVKAYERLAAVVSGSNDP
jgi:hypothetical protein